jgi:hypothetical protein
MKKIHPSSYEQLRTTGNVVPRDKNYYRFESGFKVGNETFVTNGQLNCPPIKVKCTQDDPYHLSVVINESNTLE